MKKSVLSLVLALVLAFALCANAFAVDALSLLYVAVQDKGLLGVTASTDYVGSQDMNFTAKTENGELKVERSVVLRNEGTSWFVVLDFPKNIGNDLVLTTETNFLSLLADQVRDIDEGALVLAKSHASISPVKASIFRDTLTQKPGETETAQFVSTLENVIHYINENRHSLMPNIAIVLVTPASPKVGFTNSMISRIEDIINENNGITTHIMTVAQSPENANKEWRSMMESLADLAFKSVGGTGYATKKLDGNNKDESQIAVGRINDSERRKVYLSLNPESVGNIGQKLTVAQKLPGGKELTASGRIDDPLFEIWKNTFQGEPVPVSSQRTRPSTLLQVAQPDQLNSGAAKASGISTELLVGIIAGVVVLILVLVLVLLRNKNKKPKKVSAATAYSGGGSAAQPAGVTITLIGANGSTLKGQMKGGRLTIGRDSNRGAMIAVPNDGKLSGLHATFMKQGNAMTLTDNGSTNGTKVNGNKVTGTVVIQQNDTIAMGSTTYTVSWC